MTDVIGLKPLPYSGPNAGDVRLAGWKRATKEEMEAEEYVVSITAELVMQAMNILNSSEFVGELHYYGNPFCELQSDGDAKHIPIREVICNGEFKIGESGWTK